MKFHFFIGIVGILILTFSLSAMAETRYVSDKLIVTVRSGKGNEFKVLETIPTASPVTIIEDGKFYVKVRTRKGTEGYVKRQYITNSIPKKQQISLLNKKVVALQQQLETSQQSLNSSQTGSHSYKNKLTDISTQLQQKQQELKVITEKYATLLGKSNNVLAINAENQQLIEDNNAINSEIVTLREENHKFHRTNMIQWFLAGGGVFFGGWLIGKISRKKQRRF